MDVIQEQVGIDSEYRDGSIRSRKGFDSKCRPVIKEQKLIRHLAQERP